MGLFNMFSKKSSREDKMQEHAKSQMPPRVSQVAYDSYRNNGEMFKAAQTLSEDEIQQAWFVEASRRSRELDRRDVKPISAEEVRRKAKELLR